MSEKTNVYVNGQLSHVITTQQGPNDSTVVYHQDVHKGSLGTTFLETTETETHHKNGDVSIKTR